jgi:NADPH-dependent curcumin reductase CurA
MTNHKFVLAARPVGMPKESDFQNKECPVPGIGDGEVLVQVLYISVDPYMRGRMKDLKSYMPAFAVGEPLEGSLVGRVVQSKSPAFAEGAIVEGFLPWQNYVAAKAAGLRRVDPTLGPITTALGVLGMPGLTAYFGLLEICNPKAGEMVLISGAAGAVGTLVGQIARVKGCKTVGVAGSDDKVEYITKELKFDKAFNYKTSKDYRTTLEELCPDGIDVYFDNVGGPLSDAALTLINPKARISLCGQISQYNDEKPEMGPRLLFNLIAKQARMEGFIVTQFQERYPVGLNQLASWVKLGELKYQEHITQGLENAGRAFIGMLQGENTGKALVQVVAL